ncbi:hypothetical protein AKJ09_06949 [Labilithrix luteola]|uniref:Uncharacterized protein n=1 Tax=Labilithrix luteola TaxID=1391654 RepID=A0A0K1Q370_9BACT|nr:hypothetical protein AKJ09_06949 [Labilithrix luteola]
MTDHRSPRNAGAIARFERPSLDARSELRTLLVGELGGVVRGGHGDQALDPRR